MDIGFARCVLLGLVSSLILIAGAHAHGGAYRDKNKGLMPHLGPVWPKPPAASAKAKLGPPFLAGCRRPRASDEICWPAWWNHHSDRLMYAVLRRRTADTETSTPAADATKDIRAAIVPVLRSALDDPFFDTRAAAVIALGKCGAPDPTADLYKRLKDDAPQVRESAALALGILGDKSAVPILVEVMNDTEAGRKILGRGDLETLRRTRAFAAVAIGLIGRRTDITETSGGAALLGVVADEQISRDLHAAAIVALGVMKCQDATTTLIAYLQDKKRDMIIRAFAAMALGRIGGEIVRNPLVKALRDRKNPVRQSACLALGLLTKADDGMTKTVQRTRKADPDRGVRNFAIVALGRTRNEKAVRHVRRFLKRPNRFERTHAAITLGACAPDVSDALVADLGEQINKSFRREKNFEERGAYAVALGLMGIEKAADDLLADVKKGYGMARYRSYLCIGLGLMHHKPGAKTIRKIATDRGDIELRRAAMLALGLLGEKGDAEVLAKEIAKQTNSMPILDAAARGLGFVGDASTVPILAEMVTKREKFNDLTRAFAVVALGRLGDRDDIPVLTTIAEDINHLTSTESLRELLRIL